MTEPSDAGQQPNRKVGATTREILTVDGRRVARTTRLYVDAATGAPLDVRRHDVPMPPMLVWQDEADIDEETP